MFILPHTHCLFLTHIRTHAHTHKHMTVSTEIEPPPKSSRSSQTQILVSRGTNSTKKIGPICICTRNFVWLLLLDLGGGSISVETVIYPSRDFTGAPSDECVHARVCAKLGAFVDSHTPHCVWVCVCMYSGVLLCNFDNQYVGLLSMCVCLYACVVVTYTYVTHKELI